eukprot:scaffold149_cov315-Pinguiococcus_pyrenoidosus.AAC.154
MLIGVMVAAGVACGIIAFVYNSAMEVRRPALPTPLRTSQHSRPRLPSSGLAAHHVEGGAPGAEVPYLRRRRLDVYSRHVSDSEALRSASPQAYHPSTDNRCTALGALAGFSIRYLGHPGDLPDVVMNVHSRGFVPMSQTPSMILCSLASIVAGGSLGPEAPLVAISSSTIGLLGLLLHFNRKLGKLGEQGEVLMTPLTQPRIVQCAGARLSALPPASAPSSE